MLLGTGTVGFPGALCEDVGPLILGLQMERNQTLINHDLSLSSLDDWMLLVALVRADPGAPRSSVARGAVDPGALAAHAADSWQASPDNDRVMKCASRSPSEKPSGAPLATSSKNSGSPQR
jgi:hypothetical protein